MVLHDAHIQDYYSRYPIVGSDAFIRLIALKIVFKYLSRRR